MNVMVIYKSRTGFTKRYAQWIGDELRCKVTDYGEIKKIDLDSYDLIIYGGRVHAGKIDNLDKVKSLLNNKKCDLIVFATGATPFEATEEIEKTRNLNFSDNSIPYFYMQSGLCYEKMGFFDRTIMKMLSKMLAKKENKSDIDNGTAIAISQSHDISDKSYIMPLVDYIKKNYSKA